jgi:hypothetical protein
MVVVKTIDLIQYCKWGFLFKRKRKGKKAKGKGQKAKVKGQKAKVKVKKAKEMN